MTRGKERERERERERGKRVAIYYSAAKLHQSKNARSAYINMSATYNKRFSRKKWFTREIGMK